MRDDCVVGADPPDLALTLACPACGAPVRIGSSDRGFACGSCRSAHLLLPGSGILTLAIPDLLGGSEAAFRAAGGDGGSDAGRLVGHLSFHAPYWHATVRRYEAIVEATASGRRTRAAVKRLELSAPAFDPAFRLPALGSLAAVRDAAPLGRGTVVSLLPPTRPPTALLGEERRVGRARLFDEAERLVRLGGLRYESQCLVLRPFHVVSIESGGRTRHALVDGYAGTVAGTPRDEAVAALAAAVSGRPPHGLSATLAFRPMRCPSCGGKLPLERTAEVRFCETCGGAFRVDGKRLAPVRYRFEAPDARGRLVHLPYWHVPFALTDPERGDPLRSAAAVAARLAGRPEPPGEAGLDVPAFHVLERRRAGLTREPLPGFRPPFDGPFLDGPARREWGLGDFPAVVSIPAAEAAFVARYVLFLSLSTADLAGVSRPRLRGLLVGAPFETGEPQLVLRAFRRGEVEGLGYSRSAT